MRGDGEGLLALCSRMGDKLAHRGPDGEGRFVEPEFGVGLSHRRLAILDLSDTGAQPMQSGDERFTLIHNGEIYNFLELKRELEETGGPFLPWKGDSDTEVMLAAFQTWGVEQAVTRFTGMFAFALWDRETRTLHLARDRMGEKPLYYGRAGKGMVFGSELKALRAFPGFDAELDMEALSQYLRFQYVPEPRSVYRDVFKLQPGHLMSIRADAPHNFEPKPYWTLRDAVNRAISDPFTGSEADAASELERLLRDVVRNQMLSDVPLGSLLSGGIDSSLVTALMQAESDRPVKSFTIGFADKAYDESSDAKRVAEHIGTEHTELFVTPEHVLDLVEKLPELYDEPFADASMLPTHLVAALTREHVTVCLSGDGGDETFAGYNRHFWAPTIWNKLQGVPRGLRGAAGQAAMAVSPGGYDTIFNAVGHLLPKAAQVRTPGHKVHKLADVLGVESREALYKRLCSTWPEPSMLLNAAEPDTVIDRPEAWPGLGDYTRWMQYQDTLTYLPGDILHKVDRACMGVSLESRAPYLDHRVIEFAWRLPLSMLLKGGEGKRILRSILYKHVPRELVERPKMGFGVPIDAWLRGPLREWAESLLAPERLRKQGLFDQTVVARQLADHLSGKRDNQYRIWNMLMFQAWFDKWM
ncbi:asparagine synthase (glutamine-hydrolyzing) [Pseudodesulfovibrio sp. zrk46]|uniref:asparagine synthase (glutamine-hydrolyzing) n=1 Tax=Pseudodesulfovibrio sp. zrk46 TaxID=2725288 RepID=UPI001FFD942F|nr:asparagine synthase (glutamine-hydrolyzing) [Pseudodesulfovibrio sp. zrk46]